MLIVVFFIFTYSYAKTKENKLIYIDPGHGGFDGGASASEVLEKDITLSISLMVKNYLENVGYECVLTRDEDKALANTKRDDIHKRVELINSSNCLLYLSIHANSFPDGNYYGAQCFYNNKNEESKMLSNTIQETLKKATSTTRESKGISNVYLVDHVNSVGCLVEVGFLSNEEEKNKLMDLNYQDLVAFLIYVGVIEYLSKLGIDK